MSAAKIVLVFFKTLKALKKGLFDVLRGKGLKNEVRGNLSLEVDIHVRESMKSHVE